MKTFLTFLLAATVAVALADVSSLAPQNTFDFPPQRPEYPPNAHSLIMQLIGNAAQQQRQSPPPPSAQPNHDHPDEQDEIPYPPAQRPAQQYLPSHTAPSQLQEPPYPPAQKPAQQYLPSHEPQQPAPYPPVQKPAQHYLPSPEPEPQPQPQQPAPYPPAQKPPQHYLPVPQPQPQPQAPYPPAQKPVQHYLPEPQPQQPAPYPSIQRPAQHYLPSAQQQPQPAPPTPMSFPMPTNYLPPPASAPSAPARSSRRYRPRTKVPKKPVVTKNFFIHSAPEETEEELQSELTQLAQQPRKHYNVLFVKTPTQTNKVAAVNLAKALKEEKTVVYVLSKKTTASDLQEAIAESPQQLNKPEVFFIKYRTPEEAANAQRQIQSQYDSLGGTSIITDEGYSPVTSVVGSLDAPEEEEDSEEQEQEPEQQQYDEQLLSSINNMGNNHYLPPSHY